MKSKQELLPIESAPKDGTEIICYDGDYFAITSWQAIPVYGPSHRDKVRSVACFPMPEGHHNASEWYPQWWAPLPHKED
jgi:hypothetical protein